MGRTTDLRRIILYTVIVIMASFGLTGAASAQSVITNTGAHSFNSTSSSTSNSCNDENINTVSVSNQTLQDTTSGNATGQSADLPWTGWNTLDPSIAQTAGSSYGTWRDQVTDWIAARANGAGWASTGSNPSWTSSSNNWADFDPMLWQANGQTFTNWLNAVESYLNGNSTTWILSWPAGTTSGAFGNSATSGAATSNNNSDFSINISNAAAPTAAGNCGPGVSGKGSGPSGSSSAITNGEVEGFAHANAAMSTTGNEQGQGGNNASTSAYNGDAGGASHSQSSTSPGASGNNSAPSSESTGESGDTGAYISNTGPCSTNIASTTSAQTSTVNNVNTVSITNTTTQTTSSGTSTVANNGGTGGSESGNASTTNGTNFGAGLSS